jgi:hypothetical protein
MVARFIAEYKALKADANVRNKIRSTTLDAAQYDADEDGNVDVVKSFLRWEVVINGRNARRGTPLHRVLAQVSGECRCRVLAHSAH